MTRPPPTAPARTAPADDAAVDLAVRFAAGDQEALRAIIADYGGPVRTVARSMTKDSELVAEVVQATFIKAWKASSTFDPGRDLAPWLYSIARRTAIDVLRRELRPTRGDHEPEVDVAVTTMSFEQTWERFEVRRAIDQLAAPERQVLELSHFMGLPHREIAEHLQLPIGTVKSRANRALQNLRVALGHLDDPDPR